MRALRPIVLAMLMSAPLALSGCESFDPESLTDIFNTDKRPIPGSRRAVFPEGVPGVAQGVPPELIKGNEAAAAAAAEPPPVVTAPVAEKPKPKPKPKVAAKPKPQAEPQPQQAQRAPAAAAPWPQPQSQPQQSQPPAWPSPSPAR